MLLIRKLFFALLLCAAVPVALSMTTAGNEHKPYNNHQPNVRDTPPPVLHYPIHDNRGNDGSNKNNPYYLDNSKAFNDSVVYNPVNRTYIVYEKVGDKYYRVPTVYTFDEFWAMRNRQAEIAYFQRRSNTTNILNRGKLLKPKLSLSESFFNRLFGTGKIDIVPQGSLGITLGYQSQKIDNPTLPERARKSSGLDFQQDIQLSVNASIGDKLKFPINYNNNATFNLDNQIKLDFTGKDDDIVKRFEAGTVSFSSKGTLIPGAQQLFGVKAQLQFGRLYVTTILANQKSQRQNVNLQGGSAANNFELKADEYEENRHFLIAQYFKDNYNKVMSKAPAITSPVQILRMEVWVTNRTGTTTDTRDIVGLMDLAERNPYLTPPQVNVLQAQDIPSNNVNDLYSKVISLPDARNPSTIYQQLTQNLNLTPVQDFEKTFAKKLDSNSYRYNDKLGTLSLSAPLQPDEVLGVAYQYSYRGKIFQVGEFSQDVPPDTTTATQKVLFLKLLKSTSQRVNLPIWDLMMKNVYSVGYGTLTPADFKLDVLYEQPGLGAKRYVPFGDKNQGSPIISLINLDRLNSQLDPQPDGVFDYIDGYTVNSEYSRVIFPVLEPFGRDLAPQIYNTVPANVRDTLFYALYDSIKAVAQQYPNLNRFLLRGSAKTSGSGDISIGYNIPKGSVSVTAGGRVLQEGVDYDINYDLGTIKIINQAILNSGFPVQVNFENNATFGLQQKSFMGLRLDYMLKNTAKEQVTIGGTIVRLSERPFFTKVNLGEDPIRNTMYGLDLSYKRDMPRLTKWLDKLPFYSTTAPSSMTAYAEAAMLKPGHAPQIGKGENGVIYIDDFEGSQSSIDLRFPATAWGLSATPFGATPSNSSTILFPEAANNNQLNYGFNRAKIAWYQIEQVLQQYNASNNPITNPNLLSDPRVRQVYQKEIFPQRTTGFGESQLTTFDLAYYPRERGPYNFDATNVTAQGFLTNPQTRWGGLQRNIDQTDFETANIEFIEAWVQDPFILNPTSPSSVNGGKLYFNLGNISEDVLKDGRRFYENGLPTPNAPAPVDPTIWGVVPRNPIQVTNAFSNDPADRPFQDIGLDGLNDADEAAKRQGDYLTGLAATLGGVGSPAYQAALLDPSSDDYKHYRNASFGATDGILARYKNYNSPEGNSPIDNGGEFTSAATLYPDAEDFNRDNTLNQTEEYYQYIVDLKPANDPLMQIGSNFIVDKKVVAVSLANGTTRNETWYQFRIPVASYNRKIGNIPDFKSIRFIRMFMTGFTDTAVVRFAELQLERNIWRRFKYALDHTGMFNSPSIATFNVGAVNIEENDTKVPLPYRTPRDIQRQQTLSNNGVNLLQNEQAMTLQYCDVKPGDGKAVFQTFVNKDIRQYQKLSMYIHSEESKTSTVHLQNKDMTAVFRMGTDFVNNYYEVRIPLYNTSLSNGTLNPDTDSYNDSLWNPLNSLDLDLTQLTRIKQSRNLDAAATLTNIYSQQQANGQTYSVMGNPNLGEIKGILIGIENTNASLACGEMWVNELRLSQIDEKGGYAALARIDFTLADLGTISLSGNMHTKGFGTLEQRAGERARDDFYQFDVATNLELGKLLPKKASMSIPVFASYSQSVSRPEYDPIDQDIKLKDKLSTAPANQKDSIRKTAIDFTSIKTVNFTNVRKVKTNNKRPKIYDVSNIDISYSYIKTSSHNPLIEYNDVTRHRAALGYNYATQPRYITPFRNFLKKKKTKWFDVVRDFNFNYVPTQISFRADLQRQFGVIKPRSLGNDKFQTPETYDKYFIFQRDYVLRWNLTRSLALDYTATNNSRIDEPYGRIDNKAKKDTIWRNLLRGGRNTVFDQTISFGYTLPLQKIPLLDFVTANIKYQARYKWLGASRLAVDLGNFLENSQQKEGTVQADFTKLYQKSKFLRQLDQPSNLADREKWRHRWTTIKDSVTTRDGRRVLRTRRVLDKSALPYVSTPMKVLGKLLTSVKQANFSIGELGNTRLPGYTDSTQFFGQNFRSMAPGFDFILGRQVDSNWLNRKAADGLITRDSSFNYLFQQHFDQTITASAILEPIRDLSITINIKKTFTKDYSETFRFIDTTGANNPKFMHLTPYSSGGFDVSYISFKTLFGKFDPNRVSETFKKFQDYRQILSKRIGSKSPYSIAGGGLDPTTGYYYGYGKYAVDVLIPSFIAAYTGQSPDKVALIKQTDGRTRSNPFKSIMPKPNWTLNYTGLSRIKGLDKIFTRLDFSHAYSGDLSMNGFTSALLYQDVSRFNYPSFYDTVSKSFIPFFLVPNVTIQEQFSPLIGFNMELTNQLQGKFEYSKSRTLSLSLNDFQLSEQRSTEFAIGAGYRKRGFPLFGGLKLPKFLGGGKKLENEINFRFDFRVRDNVTANSRLDQDNNFATGGSKEIRLSPSIDYNLSNRVNVKLYYDQTKIKPYISSSAPTTNTRAGLQIRVSLAP